jgi:hypothetical protein
MKCRHGTLAHARALQHSLRGSRTANRVRSHALTNSPNPRQTPSEDSQQTSRVHGSRRQITRTDDQSSEAEPPSGARSRSGADVVISRTPSWAVSAAESAAERSADVVESRTHWWAIWRARVHGRLAAVCARDDGMTAAQLGKWVERALLCTSTLLQVVRIQTVRVLRSRFPGSRRCCHSSCGTCCSKIRSKRCEMLAREDDRNWCGPVQV